MTPSRAHGESGQEAEAAAAASGGVLSGTRAKKSLGQHFLRDAGLARRIVESLGAGPDDPVLEIGPGPGALTVHLLAGRRAPVYAIEKDRELGPRLKAAHPALRLILADALRFPFERLAAIQGLRIVGNLPYNVASPLMWELFSRLHSFTRAVFMVQLEVGQRLRAEPGSKAYGQLSAWVQSFVSVRMLFKVGPGAFVPPPKVDSAVLAFEPLAAELLPADPVALAGLLHLCFQKRRKQLGTILKGYGPLGEDVLAAAGIARTARPEELSPQDFQRLARGSAGEGAEAHREQRNQNAIK